MPVVTRVCEVEGCERPYRARGMCDNHYKQWANHGSFEDMRGRGPRRLRPVEDRFWEKVDKSGGPDACWPFCGRLDKNGYGKFRFRGEMTTAHRVAYILTKGEIPEGMEAMHSCDNRPCCNPADLVAGTHAENMTDQFAKGRGRNQFSPS